MVTKKDFKCEQCGKCCIYTTVKVTDEEIEKIEKLGYKKEYFTVEDDFDIEYGAYALKQDDKGCVFLKIKDKKAYCKIYKQRPKICKDYPFCATEEIDTCKPILYRMKKM